MDFLKCEHYKKAIEVGHCPFDVVCDTNCVFTIEPMNKKIEELQAELESCFEDYRNMEWDNDQARSLQEEAEAELDEYKEKTNQYIKMLMDIVAEHAEVPVTDIRFDDDLFEYGTELNRRKYNVE